LNEQADVVVIGSGVAGALCAFTLAQRGLKVLVLEAGPRIDRSKILDNLNSTYGLDLSSGYPNPDWSPRPDWSQGNDRYIRQSGPDLLRLEYLRVVGGTTWHWGGGCDRLLPTDLRLQSSYGVGVDWPISYHDLEPYYVRAERELGVAGDDAATGGSERSAPFPLAPVPQSFADKIIAEKLHALGIPLTSRAAARNTAPFDSRPRCDGFGTCSPLCPIGAQYSAIVHVEHAEQLGARVLAESRVDRLKADANGRIIAAQFGRTDGSLGMATAKIFVVAAHGVESPRLLLASADETVPKGIGNSSDQVGRNYMDHYGAEISLLTSPPLYPNRGPIFTSSIHAFRDGPLRATEAALMIYPANQANVFDLTVDLINGGDLPPTLDSEIRKRASRSVVFTVFAEQLPQSENRVTIDWSDRDTSGQPRIQLSYTVGDYTRAGLRRGVDVVKHVGEMLGSHNVQVAFNSHSHIMGTIRMGHSQKTSVVDDVGRSHDHSNLFVVGSAVFPTSAAASPTLTIAALSLRTADAIAQQLV
jgi:glucose dehydrogenase